MDVFTTQPLRSHWLNLPVRQRGVFILAIPVLCFLTPLIVFVGLQRQTSASQDRIQQTLQMRFAAQRLLNTLVDAETGVRGYELTRQHAFLEPYSTATTTIPKALTQLKTLARDPKQRQQVQQIQRLVQHRMELLHDNLDTIKAQKPQLTQPSRGQYFLLEGKAVMDQTRAVIEMFLQEEERLVNERNHRIDYQQKLTRITLLISAIIGSAGTLLAACLFDRLRRELEDREASLRESAVAAMAQTEKLQSVLQDLEKAEVQLVQTDQLIQTEKMSSIGQMVAGIAHEINNPVTFIYGNLDHVRRYAHNLLSLISLYQQHYPHPDPEIEQEAQVIDLNFIAQDLPSSLESMKVGADRIRDIVVSLRGFCRKDETKNRRFNIHEGIDSTLLILHHRLRTTAGYPGITVIKEYGDLPLVECYAGQLNQVFMNILSNAIDALEERNREHSLQELAQAPSTITIHTEVLTQKTSEDSADYVLIRIADNGSGIPPEIRGRIFDPFFTTKGVGKGTGLGLSISYQIVVNKHGGILRCESEPGQGTEFWIQIPFKVQENLPPTPSLFQVDAIPPTSLT